MNKDNRRAIVFICCLLAMPTCVKIMDGFTAESVYVALFAGALLGLAHLLLRPAIRIATAPIGCLTLGLIQPVIDVLLIYLCDHLVPGFTAGNVPEVFLAVVLINTITFIAAGRR